MGVVARPDQIGAVRHLGARDASISDSLPVCGADCVVIFIVVSCSLSLATFVDGGGVTLFGSGLRTRPNRNCSGDSRIEIACPLTTFLNVAAGKGHTASYAGNFIEHWSRETSCSTTKLRLGSHPVLLSLLGVVVVATCGRS